MLVTNATAIRDKEPPASAIACSLACGPLRRGRIVSRPMRAAARKADGRRQPASRRIIVVAVPPVDELDLIGPLQVFNSVNRLAGRTIYSIEVVTNADRPIVE